MNNIILINMACKYEYLLFSLLHNILYYTIIYMINNTVVMLFLSSDDS